MERDLLIKLGADGLKVTLPGGHLWCVDNIYCKITHHRRQTFWARLTSPSEQSRTASDFGVSLEALVAELKPFHLHA